MNALLMALLFSAPSPAQDGGDDDLDFIKPDDATPDDEASAEDFDLFEDEEDFEMAPPIPGEEPEAAPLVALPSAAPDATPLSGGYPVQVLAIDGGAVMLELPVLVSRGGADIQGEGFWLGLSVWDGGARVGQIWQSVAPSTVPSGAPGFVYFKLQAPVSTPAGALELRVVRAATPAGAGEELFRETASYGAP